MTKGYIQASAMADTAVHFCKDNSGGYNSVAVAANTATYTSTTATASGSQNVGTAGTQGYAITSGGWYAPYTVTTGGVNGVVTVERWYHTDKTKVGQVPTGTLALYTKSAFGNFDRCRVLRISGTNITAAATVSITNAIGTDLEVFTVPVGAFDIPLNMECDGPFGFKCSANTIVASIEFEALNPAQTRGSDLRVGTY